MKERTEKILMILVVTMGVFILIILFMLAAKDVRRLNFCSRNNFCDKTYNINSWEWETKDNKDFDFFCQEKPKNNQIGHSKEKYVILDSTYKDWKEKCHEEFKFI